MSSMAKKPFFSDEDMARLRAITIEELKELDERLDADLKKISADPSDPAHIKDAILIFHTIGGSAGLTGLSEISRIGLEMESWLKKSANGSATPDVVNKILEARKRLLELIENPR